MHHIMCCWWIECQHNEQQKEILFKITNEFKSMALHLLPPELAVSLHCREYLGFTDFVVVVVL